MYADDVTRIQTKSKRSKKDTEGSAEGPSVSQQFDMKNRDLEDMDKIRKLDLTGNELLDEIQPQKDPHTITEDSNQIPQVHDYVPAYQIKKKIYYTGQQDDFFKTGVDVIEHEDVEFDGTAVDAMEAYRQGELSIQQIKEVL